MKREELVKAIDVLENIESRVKGLITNRQVSQSIEAYLKEFVINPDLKQLIVDLKAQIVVPNTNLIEKYKGKGIREKFDQWRSSTISSIILDVDPMGRHKVGEVVRFIGGLDLNIEFTSKILGFDEYGKAYLLWDSYWFPVDLEERGIK